MTKHIELNTFIKIKGIATTGGYAKLLIRSGKVQVNRKVETRNKRKLIPGDEVTFEDQTFTITDDMIR
jgi:ribosome-associated protein